jgi:hypothetical protein
MADLRAYCITDVSPSMERTRSAAGGEGGAGGGGRRRQWQRRMLRGREPVL